MYNIEKSRISLKIIAHPKKNYFVSNLNIQEVLIRWKNAQVQSILQLYLLVYQDLGTVLSSFSLFS